MITDNLSEKSRKDWPEIFERLTGKKWEKPTKDKRGITCEVKIDPKEVEQVMRMKPSRKI